ncbi:hypothetical protein NOF79_004073 [Salmonella enterica]|nr:hypothetical protein [Salmonella enterica]
MGVYRWYILFSLMVFSSLSFSASVNELNLRSALTTWPSDAECQAKPLLTYTMVDWVVRKNTHYAELYGCVYRSVKLIDCVDGSGFCKAEWQPFMSYGSLAKPDDKPSGDPDNSDDSDDIPSEGDHSGGDTGSTGGDTTPPTVPDIPVVKPSEDFSVTYPDTGSIQQLADSLNRCTADLTKYPVSDDNHPDIDIRYNNQVDQCNSIYDNLYSSIPDIGMASPSDDNHKFITKDGAGNLYSCRRNPFSYDEWVSTKPQPYTEVVGNNYIKPAKRELGFDCVINDDGNRVCNHNLNFNYNKGNGYGNAVCNATYEWHQPGGGGDLSGSSNGSGSGTGDGSGTGTGIVTGSGSGSGDTGDGDDDKGGDLALPGLDIPGISLSPLWNIWPSARDFKITLPEAQCPVFTIEVFSKDYRIDTFCTLLTPDIIAYIRLVCILVASVFSFFIVLRS